MRNPKLPQIDSIQELARFWDTHDLTDFEDQLEEVTEPIFEHKTMIQVSLRPTEFKLVRELAASKGVDSVELVREWILERIEPS